MGILDTLFGIPDQITAAILGLINSALALLPAGIAEIVAALFGLSLKQIDHSSTGLSDQQHPVSAPASYLGGFQAYSQAVEAVEAQALVSAPIATHRRLVISY